MLRKSYGNILEEGIPFNLDLLNFAKANNFKICLKTGDYCDGELKSARNKRYNETLLQQLRDLYMSGNLFPPDYYTVFGLKMPSLLVYSVLFRFPEVRENYKLLYGEKTKALRLSTNVERFGSHMFANEEVKRKIRETMIRKHGVDNPMKSPEIRKKMVETTIEHHGVDNISKLKQTREKAVATLVRKHGVKSTLKWKSTREKMKATMIERHGCENAMYSEDLKEKAKATRALRDSRYNSLHEFRNQIKANPSMSMRVMEFLANEYDATLANRYAIEMGLRGECFFNTEAIVYHFLRDLNIPEFVRNAKKSHGVIFNTRYHDLDFYFPDIKFGIEINGLSSHAVNRAGKGEPKTKDYHFRKFLKFHESGIKVVSFTDWDLYNRWDSVKNIIKHHLSGEEIEESTKVEFPDLFQSLNYGLFDYNKFNEKLKISQNFEDFCEAKFIEGWEYWDCGTI